MRKSLVVIAAAFAAATFGITTAYAGQAAKLRGHTAYFSDGGRATYSSNHRYTYTSRQGTWHGRWSIHGGDRMCVVFDNGNRRCDTISGHTLTNSYGRRFSFTLN